MIPQSFIQDLLSRVDIADVVGRVVKLRKAGANLQGLCPFHDEKSPSFTVSPIKQFYHCFGCGAHGSAIGFLMEHHGLSFVEAVEELASGLGLSVPREPSTRPRPRAPAGGASSVVAGPPVFEDRGASAPDDSALGDDGLLPEDRGHGAAASAGHGAPRDDGAGTTGTTGAGATRQQLIDLLGTAARHFKQQLKAAPAAVEYLKARGLSGETAARFGIGYAPAGWQSLEAAVPSYADPALVEAGLVIRNDEGRRYDRFRDRIMFPIRNPRGQVIGFGGRVLGQGEPKYLNSPETPVFSKGQELYGLFEAREAMRRRDEVLVVEGYMDVVMLSQHGVGQAVATLGTATTEMHVVKLLRQVDRIVFAFDGDAAGRKAAARALQTVLPRLSDTKRFDFLFLPPEHDPDSFVRAEGLDAFETLVAGAMPLSAFLLQLVCVDLDSPEGRARAQAAFKPMVAAMPDIALRQQLIAELANRARLDTLELMRYLGLQAVTRPPAIDVGRGRAPAGAYGGSYGGSRDRPAGERRFEAGASRGTDRARRGGGAPAAGFRGRERGDGRLDGSVGFATRRVLAPASLELTLRGLLALHPGLASIELDPTWLPRSLLAWRERIAALGPHASFAVVIESLRETAPRAVEALVRAQHESLSLVGDLSLDQARVEYEDALATLQLRRVRQEIADLVAGGVESPGGRDRYAALQAAERRLAGVPEDPDE